MRKHPGGLAGSKTVEWTLGWAKIKIGPYNRQDLSERRSLARSHRRRDFATSRQALSSRIVELTSGGETLGTPPPARRT